MPTDADVAFNSLMRAYLEALLTRTWLSRGPLSWVLLPVAVVYALISAIHRWWFRRGPGNVGRAGIPVIVVGNVIAGGAGKTPLVMALVQHLKDRGLAVGIVSRGHGRASRHVEMVQDNATAQDVGDEPLLLARRCQVPVAVGSRRLQAIQALRRAHPALQVVVSDDGLQPHAMHHDVALCVFDDRGLGNGWPLPAGPLREPWPRVLPENSTQFVVATDRANMPGAYVVQRALARQAINGRGQTRPLSDWRDQTVTALAGIARPQSFFDMLQAQGVRPRTLPLPDHADTALLAQTLAQLPRHQDVLCTEKDAVKLWPQHPDVWAVPLELKLPEVLMSDIDRALDPKLSSPHGQQTA
jgi:tetraacyldisaccharide 4'-kinase